MKINAVSAFAVVGLSLLSSGCAVGSKDFACPGRPPGVRCMSATEVYSATHTTDRVQPTSDEALGDDPNKAKKKSKEQVGKSGATPVHHPYSSPPSTQMPLTPTAEQPQYVLASSMMPAVQKPVPIRTPARVMRVWIAPWENSDGILNGGGYSFIEVESRRWIVGEQDPSVQPVRHFSIQNAKVESKEPVGKDQSTQRTASVGSSERQQRPNSNLPNQGVSK